jgi:hypothetical protein
MHAIIGNLSIIAMGALAGIAYGYILFELVEMKIHRALIALVSVPLLYLLFQPALLITQIILQFASEYGY